MNAVTVSPSEAQRVAALRRLRLLDMPTDRGFDHIVRQAQLVFGAPIALISMVDSDRVWFLSKVGTELTEVSRDMAFCTHAILADNTFIISDTSQDERFVDNPLVRGAPFLRAYAGVPLHAPGGEKIGILSIIDIVPRSFNDSILEPLQLLARLVEDKLSQIDQKLHLTYHDSLTGLPNRLSMQMSLTDAIDEAREQDLSVALLYLNIDQFRNINQSLGHAAGDTFLVQLADRLRKCAQPPGFASRIGADEFMIVLAGQSGNSVIAEQTSRILKSIAEPFDIEGQEVIATASIGVSLFPRDGSNAAELVNHADRALYFAKRSGRNTVRFFTKEMNIDAVASLRFRNELMRAAGRNAFVLHYQPQIDLNSGAIVGAEALIRWNHPTLGLVSPANFIPAAEETGLIVEIGEWTIRQACRQAAIWQQNGMPAFPVAVNISAVQFKRDNFEEIVRSALNDSGLDPRYLELELTESILISDGDATLATIEQLKALGVRLSIDDFGTGYSSLAYLRRFKFDKLKIDRSFVQDLGSDQEDPAIVKAIIQMASSMNFVTIAEGVENASQLTRLNEFHCNTGQGYLFSRPLTNDAFEEYVARSSNDTCPESGVFGTQYCIAPVFA